MTEQKQVKQANKMYKLIGGVPTKEVVDKFPPQCQVIIGIIANAPDCTINRFDLLTEMVKNVKTGQPIERILSFYSPRLKKSGLVEIIGPVRKTAEEKAAEKAAKAEAAAAAKALKAEEKAKAKAEAKAAKAAPVKG